MGLLGGLGKIGGALLNPLGFAMGSAEKSVGNYDTMPLNPAADPVAKGIIERSQAGDDQVVADQTQGIDQGAQFLPGAEESARANTALGRASPSDLSQALSSRARKAFDRSTSEITQNARTRVAESRFKRLGDAAQALNQKDNLAYQNYSRKVQEQTAKKNARMAVVGALVSGGASYAGMQMGQKAGATQAAPTGAGK